MRFAFTVHGYKNQHIELQKLDAVVVLTGGKGRLEKGYELLQQSQAEKLLLSGVNNQVKKPELLLAMPHAHQSELDKKMDLGYLAQDTQGNATEAKIWVEHNHIESLWLVTADYHMPRALVEFQRAMPHVKIIAMAVATPQFSADNPEKKIYFLRLLAREYIKMIRSAFRL